MKLNVILAYASQQYGNNVASQPCTYLWLLVLDAFQNFFPLSWCDSRNLRNNIMGNSYGNPGIAHKLYCIPLRSGIVSAGAYNTRLPSQGHGMSRP